MAYLLQRQKGKGMSGNARHWQELSHQKPSHCRWECTIAEPLRKVTWQCLKQVNTCAVRKSNPLLANPIHDKWKVVLIVDERLGDVYSNSEASPEANEEAPFSTSIQLTQLGCGSNLLHDWCRNVSILAAFCWVERVSARRPHRKTDSAVSELKDGQSWLQQPALWDDALLQIKLVMVNTQLD